MRPPTREWKLPGAFGPAAHSRAGSAGGRCGNKRWRGLLAPAAAARSLDAALNAGVPSREPHGVLW